MQLELHQNQIPNSFLKKSNYQAHCHLCSFTSVLVYRGVWTYTLLACLGICPLPANKTTPCCAGCMKQTLMCWLSPTYTYPLGILIELSSGHAHWIILGACSLNYPRGMLIELNEHMFSLRYAAHSCLFILFLFSHSSVAVAMILYSLWWTYLYQLIDSYGYSS